jgi:hypothetical protein
MAAGQKKRERKGMLRLEMTDKKYKTCITGSN